MRKPKTETPLRQVRLASGRSQKEFAAYLGLNCHLYHSLELGRVKLTRDKANSIAQKTGVAPESLTPKTRGFAMSMDGGPYMSDSWKSWQNGRSFCPWQRVEDLLQWTTFLCRIADCEGKLATLCFELCDCLTKARDKFDLDRAVERELSRTKARMIFLCKYGDLRANRQLAQRMRFRDEESKVPDDRVWDKDITYTPTWSPHSLLPPELAKRFNLQPRPGYKHGRQKKSGRKEKPCQKARMVK